MRSVLINHLGVIARRMACVLAAALLTCASTAHGQVIEEGAFPVKGGGISGGSFSLSCPPRLVAHAGESVLLSCSATGVPEEGVRYSWESVPGEGLRLLSDANERSPLFTAPSSAAGAEYTYRLTAMAAGVHQAATVTVSVEGASGEPVRAPGLQEKCDPITIPDEPGQGCASWEREPDPFGFDPESEGEFLFPEAPGPPSGPVRGGGFDSQTPPRLECPVAVFLEELETGAIECHVWDASGEEYLEYSWEPVGNTTRDYLDNPRLIPEDSPTPSVIAPEAPVHETLESFRSGETTFHYRYRLTAVSRATGLSSSSEVEVYVSSSRPDVYCPLEIVVEEGETVTLDCEGADPLSFRMDYDEEATSIWWEWEGLWGTSTAPLDATDLSSPLFTAPAGSAGEEYHYIASMTTSASGVSHTARRRVTVRVAGEEGAEQALAPVSKANAPSITCEDAEIYEATDDFPLDCSAQEVPDGATYLWTARGSTSGTDDLSNTDSLGATFSVPENLSRDTNYSYTVTMTAGGVVQDSEDVTVRVLEKPNIQCAWPTTELFYDVLPGESIRINGCPDPYGFFFHRLSITSSHRVSSSAIDCRYTSTNIYCLNTAVEWIPRTSQHVSSKAARAALNSTNLKIPIFTAPKASPFPGQTIYYLYSAKASAINADPLTVPVTVRVTTQNLPQLQVACSNSFADEGDPDFPLECRASGAWPGYTYTWHWSPIGNLTGRDAGAPIFNTPHNVDGDTTYAYTVKVTSQNHHPDSTTVNVTVRNVGSPRPIFSCTSPLSVYEGVPDFPLMCMVRHAPEDAAYSWSSRGAPADTSLLSATNVVSPTFNVPDNVDSDTDYSYTVTLSSSAFNDISVSVTVTVLNQVLAITCTNNEYEIYESSSGVTFDCAASGAAPDASYAYTWSSPDTSLLSATDVVSPAFVPKEVSQDTDYEYLLTATVENATAATETVTVRVLNGIDLSVQCIEYSFEVDEGDPDFRFDCIGFNAPSQSGIKYLWTPGTLLKNPRARRALFLVPDDVSQDTTFEYTMTASIPDAIYNDGTVEVTVTVKDRAPSAPVVTCADPDEVYEGSADIALDCSVTNEPSGATYAWAARGSTSDTDALSNTDSLRATFSVPDNVDADTDYEYTVTLSASGIDNVTEDITVTVFNKEPLTLICALPPSPLYEGSGDFDLDCTASGAPSGSTYNYVWTPRGSTANTDLLIAGTDGPTPTFAVPDTASSDETYEYTLTVSAENADAATAEVTVTVLNKKTLFVFCAVPASVFEGSEDVLFDCSASGAPGINPDYTYAWTPRGDTPQGLLSEVDIASPTFAVPDTVSSDKTYEYTLTVSAENADTRSIDVTLKVLNAGELALACTIPLSVYEGAGDVLFDCGGSGAPGEDPQYTYAWTGDAAALALLDVADIASPTFAVPQEVTSDETYAYTLTISAGNADDARLDVAITVLNKRALSVGCTGPDPVYEGSADITLDCEASGAPGDNPQYTYVWTARGDTQDVSLLSAADIASPTFYVPDELDATTTHEYLLTASAENAESGSAEVTVTVLNHGALSVVCVDPPSVYEGSADFELDCSASGAPAGSEYAYAWTARGNTANTDLLIAGTDGPSPTFAVPVALDATTTYEYFLTASAENAESGSAEVTVTVLSHGALSVVCVDPPSVYEGSADITLDCSASGAPAGSEYAYAWTAGGNTANTDLLIAGTDGPSPTFAVPAALDATTTYEYLLTASAENAESGSAEVTVTVLSHGALSVVCVDPPSIYEGSEDFNLDCSASGAPAGSEYAYVWTAQGSTANTALLIAGTDGPSPTFAVPAALDATTTYEYLLTASAENAESGSAEVTVTVLSHGALSVVCVDPPSIYEGSEDFNLDCSASGAPAGSEYAYVWTAQGSTANTALLIAGTDGPSPTFAVPAALDATTTYEYLLTASAENAESGSAEVTVTVLNKGALAVTCAAPGPVYEGSEDITFDCSASGAPEGSSYTYAWTARGDTPDTALLSATDIASLAFYVPNEVDATTTYEYLLTVSAENAEEGTAEVSVTVLNKEALAVTCAAPGPIYEGSEDITFDCSASGAPEGSSYTYAWTARGDTPDTALLSATDIAFLAFYVPNEVDATTTYEYLLTVSAENAESGSAEVSVTVLNKGALALVCADPGSAYEGSEDIAFDCSASGAPGANPQYTYVWTVRGDTQDTSLLSAVDIASPTFHVPEEVDEDETYEYLLTARATNAEDATAEVTVTVLDRIQTPDPDPVSPPMVSSSSAREPSDPSALGVTVSASPLLFGVQSADTQVSLDPMTDQLSTHVSGPYHAGRMTLAPGGEALDEKREMDLSIELTSPVLLKRADAVETSSLVLEPAWSLAESCEQLSSQTIESLYTEVTLSEADCRLLLFGGELDLTDVPSGQYAGNMDIILRSGEREETFAVEVSVTIVPAQRVITIGPGGVRFSTSRELPVSLTEEQNLSIYPDVAFLTEEQPHGVFELSNPSLIPLEISVSARFGYTEATENGHEVVVEDVSASRLSDLSEVVDIHPGVLVLQPGEKGLIRYGVKGEAHAEMAQKGYAAFFDVVSAPRQYVRSDRMPEEVSGDRTARVTMRVPGVYVPGEGASQLRAALSSISYVGSLSATFLLDTQDHPFVGEVVAYDGDGRELGRRETLVYTRSRVRVPLDRMPEAGTVFLHFIPRGSDRAPLPTSVEWDAPRRDIGAVEDKARATTTATLVQKP